MRAARCPMAGDVKCSPMLDGGPLADVHADACREDTGCSESGVW